MIVTKLNAITLPKESRLLGIFAEQGRLHLCSCNDHIPRSTVKINT